MFTLDWITLGTTSAAVASAHFLHSLWWFERLFVRGVLKLCFVSPRASTCKELDSVQPWVMKEMTRQSDAEEEEQLCKDLISDMELVIHGMHVQVVQILRGLFASRDDFFLHGMDAIIISALGTEIVVVRYPPAGYDRCAFFNITSYGNAYGLFDKVLTCVVGLSVLVISANTDVRDVVMSCWGLARSYIL
jgi:hypothetical protein